MADVTSPFGFPYPESTDLVRDGAADIEALAQAANDQFSAGFQFAGQRIYTSSGLFVKADPLGTGDIGLRAIRVRCLGGGGGGTGGSGSSARGGAGGSAGSFGESFITDVAGLSASVTVVRGAGGAGGISGGNAFNNGSNGGLSSFDGDTVTGQQGRGGVSENTRTGAEGSIGDIAFDGACGMPGGGTNNTMGGSGGSSQFGSGGAGVGPFANNSNGPDGRLFGSGGAGARIGGGTPGATGGAGSNGIVIIDCFV